jgi:5-methylcytosine-specific restriction endonuclease McrA
MIGGNYILVLNKSWTAINVITLVESMKMLCRETADAMDPETYQLYTLEQWIERSTERVKKLPIKYFIKTPNCLIERPEIILLRTYYGMPFTEVNFTRRNLYKRDNYTCQYCNKQYGPSNLNIDHVIPTSRGGRTSWNNCVVSCVPCNSKKANMILSESGLSLLTRPKMPQWLPVSGLIPRIYPDSWNKFLKK